MIIGIDPGPTESALVTYGDGPKWNVIGSNDYMRQILYEPQLRDRDAVLAIEMIASYGMPVGREVFETCVWIGRFVECWPLPWRYVYRKDVKLHLCGSLRAKDANVRQAMLDRFPATGGGKVPQIGTKKQPGPLYGFKSHMWSALAVAITAAEVTA